MLDRKKLESARKEKKLSQRKLAELIGVQQSRIARLEDGTYKKIDNDEMARLASVLDKPASWLSIGGVADIYEPSPLARLIDEITRTPDSILSDRQVQSLIDFFREFRQMSAVAKSMPEGQEIRLLSPDQKEKALMDLRDQLQETRIHKLPLLEVAEKAAAGYGTYTTQSEPLYLAQHRWRKGYRPFKITGDSMKPFIMDGDYVVVDLLRPPVDGDTVLARVDDGLIVKKFVKNRKKTELVSVNPGYEPITGGNVSILGVLIDIVRPVKKVLE